MSFKLPLILAAGLSFAALPALAEITIENAYAKAAASVGKSSAAFFEIVNSGPEADRLIDAKSDAAKRVELHTHKDMGEGIMKMMHVPEGFEIGAGETHALERGGDHVMIMGVVAPLVAGETVSITLVFEQAGEITLDVPIEPVKAPAN
ncbi:MAG: copper(I)-binding protein [Halocynthiibacter sp.]|jgi:copper(I)-binding protein